MDAPVELEAVNVRGHFEVVVDGRVVVNRQGGLMAKLLRKPWPDPEDVVSAVRAAIGQQGPSSSD